MDLRVNFHQKRYILRRPCSRQRKRVSNSTPVHIWHVWAILDSQISAIEEIFGRNLTVNKLVSRWKSACGQNCQKQGRLSKVGRLPSIRAVRECARGAAISHHIWYDPNQRRNSQSPSSLARLPIAGGAGGRHAPSAALSSRKKFGQKYSRARWPVWKICSRHAAIIYWPEPRARNDQYAPHRVLLPRISIHKQSVDDQYKVVLC